MGPGYFIKINDTILEAIKHAENKIDTKKFNSKKLIPLRYLENVCEINLKNKQCPIKFQYIWFCLDKEFIFRKFSTGLRKLKVSFPTTYVENSEKNKKIILEAYNSCKRPKSKIFSKLTCKNYVSIREYIQGKNKIPLFAFLKACQLLNKDPWTELENCKIYSRSSDRSKFIIFKNKISPELYTILNWINLEGFLSLDRPTITLSQHIKEYGCLMKIKIYFHQVFNLPNSCISIVKSDTIPNMLFLIINSAPLRQILNLKHNLYLGYKSRKIKPNPYFDFNKEDSLKILASELETEGSFSKHYKKDITYCNMGFSTYSKEYSLNFFEELNRLGYKASFIKSRRERFEVNEEEYRVEFWRSLDLQRLAFEILPYFHHKTKTMNLIEVFKQKNYLKITRVNFNENLKKLIYKAKNKCGGFKELSNELKEIGFNISPKGIGAWIYNSSRVSVLAILEMCKIIGDEDYFNYLPKELAFSLWINDFISREKAEDLRGIKGAYKHILLNRNLN